MSRILRCDDKGAQQQRLTTGASSKKKQGGPAYHTWYNANRALSAFKAYCELFLSSKDLAFEKIDVQLVQRYRQHCLYVKGNSQVTVSRKLTPVFFVLKSANMEGLANLPSSQFQQSVLCQVTPHRYGSEADANLSRAIDNCNRSIGRRLKTAFAVKALNSARLNVHIISHLLGHSSVVVTEKVYARFLMPTLSKEVEEKLTFWEYSTE